MILKLDKKEKDKLINIGLTEEELNILILALIRDNFDFRDDKIYRIITKIERIIKNKNHTAIYKEFINDRVMSEFNY